MLYRMSTDKQDLTMQEKVCREYCKENQIEIIEEYYEPDVSGYKTPLKDRKVLLEILERSDKKKDFDTLILYFYDRLIRRNDEAPLILNILKQNQITLFDVKNNVVIENKSLSDDLLNYIKFWTAENESYKTSQRVKDSLKVKYEKGEWGGGIVPYGYESYVTNKVNHRGRVLKELRINQTEAETVKEIFRLCTEENMGNAQIANILNESPKHNNRQYRRRNPKTKIVEDCSPLFKGVTVWKILKNPIYIGLRRYNTVSHQRDSIVLINEEEHKTQDYREDLRIIDDETFNLAQELIKGRRKKKGEATKAPSNSEILGSGLCYCSCGQKLVADFTCTKYKNSKGKVTTSKHYRYTCSYGRFNRKEHRESFGKISYGAKKYDDMIREEVLNKLSVLEIDDVKEIALSQNKEQINKIKDEVTELELKINKCKANIEITEKKIDDDMENIDIYIKTIRRNQESIEEYSKKLDSLNNKLNQKVNENKNSKKIYDNIQLVKKVFQENDNLEKQKVALYKIVERINFKDNGIKIVFKEGLSI